MIQLLLVLLSFYPYAIGLSTSEATPGAAVVATISAPAGSTIRLDAPAFVTVGPIQYLGGETYQAELRVAADAPLAREPLTIGLIVDGALVSTAHLRVHTEDVIPLRFVWLPLVAK